MRTGLLFFFFFLCLSNAQGMSIAASPSSIVFGPLDEQQHLFLMNGGDDQMQFRITHDGHVEVTPKQGIIPPKQTLPISIKRTKDTSSVSSLRISTEGGLLAPGLTIPITVDEKPRKAELAVKNTVISQSSKGLPKKNIGLAVIALEILVGVGIWKKVRNR